MRELVRGEKRGRGGCDRDKRERVMKKEIVIRYQRGTDKKKGDGRDVVMKEGKM